MTRLDGLAAAAARLAGTRGAILCFHGLDVDGEPSRSSMHISLEHLGTLLDAVQRLGRVVPLRDIVTRHLAGRPTAGLVALTADDAYASWLGAESLLVDRGIPLTIFAVSGALAGGPKFWWDRIDDSASRTSLERWRQFEGECGLPEAYRRGQPAGEGVARPLRQWVLAEHAGRWPRALEESLARLERELGRSTLQRSMTVPELSGFLSRTGAEVGVHTVTHAALPFLPDDEVVTEVRHGHEELRSRFPEALPYLAIPFGLFEARTLRLAAEAGMAAAFTLEGLPLDQTYAPEFGVPRVCVVRELGPGMLLLKASRAAGPLGRLRHGTQSPYPILPSATT